MLFGLADFATGFANLFFHIFFFSRKQSNISTADSDIMISLVNSKTGHDHFIISPILQLCLCYLKYGNKTLY